LGSRGSLTCWWPLQRMVFEAKMRWRIERDHQDLKQELRLGRYEGRGWRGFLSKELASPVQRTRIPPAGQPGS